jgi:hypothetical protein
MVADVAPGSNAIRVGCKVGVVRGVSGMEGGSGVAVGGCDVAVGGAGVGGTEVAVAGSGVAVSVMGVCGMSILVGGCESVQALIMTAKVKSGSGHRIMFLFISSAPCWVKMFLSARVGGRSHPPLPGGLVILPHPAKNGPFALLLNHKGAVIARAKAAKNCQSARPASFAVFPSPSRPGLWSRLGRLGGGCG